MSGRAYNINITEMLEDLELQKIKYDLDDIDQLKRAIEAHKKEGKKIISHFNKMQEYYDEWQNMLTRIDDAINQMERDQGLSREEILKPVDEDVLDILDQL